MYSNLFGLVEHVPPALWRWINTANATQFEDVPLEAPPPRPNRDLRDTVTR